jgi:hypothetical protein
MEDLGKGLRARSSSRVWRDWYAVHGAALTETFRQFDQNQKPF